METVLTWLLVFGPLLLTFGAAIYWGNGSKLIGLWGGFFPGVILLAAAACCQWHIVIAKSEIEQNPSETALATIAKVAKETADRQIALERPILAMMVDEVAIPWLRNPPEKGKGSVTFTILNGGRTRGIITKAIGGVKILSSLREEAGAEEWIFLRKRSFGANETFKFEVKTTDNVSPEDQIAVRSGKKILVFFCDYSYLGLMDDSWPTKMLWVYDPNSGRARPVQPEELSKK
jgi:hypothetical protein